jgi:hypothetical protein
MTKDENIETVTNVEETIAEETVANAVKEGAEAGSKAAKSFMPNIGDLLSKSVYGSCYGVSYAVTFAAVAVAKILPLDNVVGEGFHDGAQDATDRVEKLTSKKEEAEAAPKEVLAM